MKKLQGKFLFEFNIGDKLDFIDENNLILFTLIEETGNVLPTFRLVFYTYDSELLFYLNEGNDINVTFGENEDNSIKTRLVIFSQFHTRNGDNLLKIAITGFYSKLSYLDTGINITNKIDNSTALRQIGSKFFIVDSNLKPRLDEKMYHRQYNISNKNYINNIWLSTYIPDSFVALAITSEGQLIIRDMKKKYSEEVDYNIDMTKPTEKTLNIDPAYNIVTQTGFINSWLGTGRKKFLYDLDEGRGLIQSEKIDPMVAISKTLMINADREKKNFENGIINENVHKNYWRAYLRNLTSLALFSTMKLTFSFQNNFKKIKPLDSLLFKEFDTNKSKNYSAEYSSGIYIITKVVRKIHNRTFYTLCEANRESFNKTKGNLR